MLHKLSRRLLLANLLVFIVVLGVFSLFVYGYSAENIYGHERKSLNTLADSVIASIDFDDHGKSDVGQPDLISSVLPEESSKALGDMRLQWFDHSGVLLTERGRLQIAVLAVPFSTESSFQIQANPHALILTKPGYSKDKLLGYVRIATPLADADAELNRLVSGLTLGMVAALCLSAAGIFILLRISLQPIRSSMDRLRQFTADASHDFRSPLMAIKSNSGVALRYPDGMRSSDQEKFLMIGEATDRMIKLTEDLLLLAQAEGEVPLQSDTVNIAELLDSVVETYTVIMSDKNIKIGKNYPQSLSMIGEAASLRRLFANLIQNAFQYTPENGRILITANKLQETMVVTIEDTGIGIDQLDQVRIFDRFWRADKARSAQESGSGLGLAIAQAIAKQHGGEITVASNEGSGSCFRVSIRNTVSGAPI